jgi:NAD+ diphosphatase
MVINMNYCTECGEKLTEKHLDGEGMIPYCPKCREFRFPIFSTAVSMIVLSPDEQKILLIQQYGKSRNILVAGYVNKGESAEEAAVREIKEETNLDVLWLRFNKTEYFAPSNTLMINFICKVSSDNLCRINHEIDKAQWFTRSEAEKNIMPHSLAENFLMSYLQNNGTN